MSKEKIEQPDIDIQRLVSDMLEQEPERVAICGHVYSITWLKKRTIRKFTHIMLKEQDAWRRSVKACACILLNRKNGVATWLLLRLWYGVYWRWLYYIRDIDQVEVLGVVYAAKKKIQSEPLAIVTILLTAMMDTTMTMARHEVGQAEHAGEQPTR